jgi:hypothetical protein
MDQIKMLSQAAGSAPVLLARQKWQIDLVRHQKTMIETASGYINPLQYDHERAEQLYHQQSSSTSAGQPAALQDAPGSSSHRWGDDDWGSWWEQWNPKRARNWDWSGYQYGSSSSWNRAYYRDW